MKTLLITLAVLAATAAHANLQCGYPPFVPMGCQSVCVCSNGQCNWVQLCK